MNEYGEKHYIRLVNSWKKRADHIRNEKYEDWQSKIENRLNSVSFDIRLAGLLGIDDVNELSHYGSKDRLISAITGFKENEIRKLHTAPSDSRDLMFAFAFVLGYEYRLVSTENGSLLVYCDDELNRYFDDADMPLPDHLNLNDYIDICAGMYFEECNRGRVFKKNRLITLKELQENLRKQINEFILDLNEFMGWEDFYKYYFDEKHVSNAEIKKNSGLEDVDINSWKERMPEKAEHLFIICICFGFNAIQTIRVFDRFWRERDEVIRPDLHNQNDLRWLYLAENYPTLRKMHYRDQIQAVKDYYESNNLRKSKNLTILQFNEIFSRMRFTMERNNKISKIKDAKTIIVADQAELALLTAVSDYDRVFIHVKDGPDPMQNAPTGLNLGYRMDVLHAADPARILWYRGTADRETDNTDSGSFIKDIYYKKQPDNMATNMENGAQFLMDWIADNSVNDYMTKCFDLDNRTQTLTWNTYLTNLQLKNGKYPARKDLICLGVILSMPKKGINSLLKCYGYKGLSEHDLSEYILIRILDEIADTFPKMFKFYAPYTANRQEIDHGIQNIGGRRKAERKEGKGSQQMIKEWYKNWFRDYQGNELETIYDKTFVKGKTAYTIEPDEYIMGWSIRRHVLWCLYKARLGSSNWLINGLSNPLNTDEEISFDRIEFNQLF